MSKNKINYDNYPSRQIAVYKTSKNLAEFNNKLNVAPIEKYASLHADGDLINKTKVYSRIGVVLQDYSTKNTIRVEANLKPSEIFYIYNLVKNNVRDIDIRESRVFNNVVENGLSTVTKLFIHRADSFVDKNGEIIKKKCPFTICIENGLGKRIVTSTGGAIFKEYKREALVTVYLTDKDMFLLMRKVARFIEVWESCHCPSQLMLAEMQIEQAKASNGSQRSVENE